MAKALSAFYPFVLPHVLGAPNPVVDQALLNAAAEFCRETKIYQEISTQDVVDGQPDYDVDVPTGMRLSAVLGVWVGDSKLNSAGTDEVQSGVAIRGAVGDQLPLSMTPTTFFQKTPNEPTISLSPVPDVALVDYLAIRAAFEPLPGSTSLPDQLYDYHVHDIANGAIAYLMSLPGQAFSNPGLSMEFRQRFWSSIGRVRSVSRSGRLRRELRVQPRAFA